MTAVTGGGATAWAVTTGGSPSYVTAVAHLGQVSQTLDEAATLEPVSQFAVAFQVSGQVAAVAVKVGQRVSAGQLLGQLDTTALAATLASDQSTLSAYQARLATDEASEAAAVSSSSPVSTASPSSSGTSGNARQLAGAQAQLAGAQQRTDADSARAQQTLARAEATCQSPAGSGTGQAAPTGTTPAPTGHTHSPAPAATGAQAGKPPPAGTAAPTTTPTTSAPARPAAPSPPPATAAPTSTTGAAATGACSAALQASLNSEQQVAVDERAVSNAERAIASQLGSSSAAAPAGTAAGGTGGGGAGTAAGGTGGGGAGAAASGTGGGGAGAAASGVHQQAASPQQAASLQQAASPQQIAADQASIDAASDQLTLAQDAIAEARLTSPIDGTVAAVGITPGQTVPAGSSNDAITVVNPGAFYALAEVPLSDLGQVKVGDPALVVPAGSDRTLTGQVSSLGVMGNSASSQATLPLDISLPHNAPGLFAGAQASVQVIVGQATSALVVPTSAVRTFGSRHLVDIVVAGEERPTPVSLGAVGPTITQVTAGLRPGQRVVLADPSQALPSSSSTASGALGAARLAGVAGGARIVRTPGG